MVELADLAELAEESNDFDLDLTPIDVEHALCEFSKYYLIRSGADSGTRREKRLRRTWQ